MTKIEFNDAATAAALQSMSRASADLNASARNYMTTLENDVFGNLSGTSVQNFMNQSNTHCENIAKVASDLNKITTTLNEIRAHHAEKDTTISRAL